MRFIFSFLLVFTGLFMSNVHAQQSRFLFIQTENRQPFNVTLNKKMYSSTAAGYLIVPKLAEGKYTITVGFGGNTVADQVFNIAIGKKDVGFNLKNFADKGWGLFNLQSFDVTMSGEELKNGNEYLASAKPTVREEKSEVKRFEPDGQSAKITPEVTATKTGSPTQGKAEEKPAGVSPEQKNVEAPKPQEPVTPKQVEPPLNNTVVVYQGSLETAELPNAASTNAEPLTRDHKTAEQPIRKKDERTKANITRISQIQGTEAFYITYTDASSSGTDTIQLLVPNVKLTSVPPKAASQQKEDLRFLDIETKQDRGETMPKQERTVPTEVPVNAAPASAPQQCLSVASTQDFLNLRKTMAAATSDGDMLNEARNTFKRMCFGTTQVKNLSFLFLTDQGRYNFFALAYPHVTDQKEFASLSTELTDPDYLNRFKAILIK